MLNYSLKIIKESLKELFDTTVEDSLIQVSETRKEFEGDLTLICFPLLRMSKTGPEQTAEIIGKHIVDGDNDFNSYNVIKGFLNLQLSDKYWHEFLNGLSTTCDFGQGADTNRTVLIESCSPNTNKPLHLGHIRNILLGDSIHRILSLSGTKVQRVQIINNRGIAISKSMLAWKKYGEGKTPDSEGVKPDHFVGQYYVLFEKKFQAEYSLFKESEAGKKWYSEEAKKEQSEDVFFKAQKNKYFNTHSGLGAEAKAMLLDWENNDPDTMELWNKMNSWVYAGFDITYDKLKVGFDKLYYESETYLRGKALVQDGLDKELFYQQEDGSVWVDLESYKLDKKILLRSDGTSVYITQDIGTAQQRYEDFKMDGMVYVVGDEQIYHFKALFAVLDVLGESYSDSLYNLAYGMVDLPDGKMKSREGTVVDADDLIAEVIKEAHASIAERTNISEMEESEIQETAEKIGLAALKYFIVRINPKKRMVFNPAESVDMQGQTGPYIQYSYVRINGLLNRAKRENLEWTNRTYSNDLLPQERALAIQLSQFPTVVQEAAKAYDPSLISSYCYQLARLYHRMWTDVSIFNAEEEEKLFRILLSESTGHVIKKGMELLGIEMPHKM